MSVRPAATASLLLLLGFVGATAGPAAAAYTIAAAETFVTAPNGNRVYVRVLQPAPTLYPGRRFAALIAIPGGTGAGAPLADNAGYRAFATEGFVVAAFNPEGRGNDRPGNLRSEGTEDCNGFRHQDDLKAVVEYLATLATVDVDNIGVQTSSFGIAIGAGALGRYPTLPVRYLVDGEGPHDSRVVAFYDAGRERAVCGHLSTASDPSPANAAFWLEREAVRYVSAFPGRYLRMQAEIDHAQNPGYFRHAIEMIAAATRPEFGGAGAGLWTRMNGSDVGNPANTVYPIDDTAGYPQWVSGRLADHPGLELGYVRELAAGSATPLAGKTLNVSDSTGEPSDRRLTVTSRDGAVAAPGPDHADAPTVAGALLEVRNPDTGESAVFALPAANWKGSGRPAGTQGYRYADRRRASGPCTSVSVRNGHRLQAKCSGAQIGFSLDEPAQGSLALVLTMGNSSRACLLFGGRVVRDVAGRFQARDAPAPANCE